MLSTKIRVCSFVNGKIANCHVVGSGRWFGSVFVIFSGVTKMFAETNTDGMAPSSPNI